MLERLKNSNLIQRRAKSGERAFRGGGSASDTQISGMPNKEFKARKNKGLRNSVVPGYGVNRDNATGKGNKAKKRIISGNPKLQKKFEKSIKLNPNMDKYSKMKSK